YTQLLCQSLFDAAVSSGGTVTQAHLDDVVSAFVREPSPHTILTWNGLKLETKAMACALAAISDENSGATPSAIIGKLAAEEYPVLPDSGSIRQSAADLADDAWVQDPPKDGAYRFTMELVRRWVAANRSVAACADEARKQLLETIAPAWRQVA